MTSASLRATPVAGHPTPPPACYCCGEPRLTLQFEGRHPAVDATAYSCTSFGHGRHQPIWRCEGCGLLVQWPQPSGSELRASYEAVEDPLYVSEQANRYLTFRRVIRRLGPPSGRSLLDVGAYCGYFVDVAVAAGFQAEGLELSAWAAAEAGRLGVEMHVETLAERAAAGARYDVVTMWDVIEHLADPRAELEQARALLAPGGHLYLSTIDAGSVAARVLGRRWPWLMGMHLFYFDRATITRVLEQAGFRVTDIRTYTHFVSARYLLQKAAGTYPAADRPASALARRVPARLRVPVNLGDNMMVTARCR